MPPDAVVNCAAFHNVERCEAEPQSAFAINAIAVNAMAEACAERGTPLVTLSTDYVFDGELGRPYTEAERPRPVSVYGASKYAGELLTLRLQSAAYVVRTCGVYATRASTSKGYTFIDRIIAQAQAGEPLRIVRDQTVSPTYAPHLAEALLRLLQSGAPYGVYHMVNEGAVTWYDYAREALRIAGIADAVEPVSYTEWPSKVRRPPFSALENAKLHDARDTLTVVARGRRSVYARSSYTSVSGTASTAWPFAKNIVSPTITGGEVENGCRYEIVCRMRPVFRSMR